VALWRAPALHRVVDGGAAIGHELASVMLWVSVLSRAILIGRSVDCGR